MGFLILGCPFSSLFLLNGINVLLRPKVFNEYNDFTFLGTYTLMWVGGINALASLLIFSILNSFPLILRIIIISAYVILIFSIIFPDVVNKYTKHDIRGKYSNYFLYVYGVPVVLCLTLLIFGKMFGLMFE